MLHYCLEVKLKNDIIANCFYRYEGASKTIKRVVSIIDNYNKNLYGLNLPCELVMLRMLEEENEKGNLKENRASLRFDSYLYLHKEHPDFKFLIPNENPDLYGRIGITAEDKHKNLADCNMKIIVNLDENIVYFDDMIRTMTIDDFKKGSLGSINIGNFRVPDIDIKKVPFNLLDEAYEFVKNNSFGWLSPDKIFIYLPYST